MEIISIRDELPWSLVPHFEVTESLASDTCGGYTPPMSIDPIGALPASRVSAASDPLALPANIRDGSLVLNTYGSTGYLSVAAMAANAPLVTSVKTAPLISPVEPVGPVESGRRIDTYA